MMSTVTVSTAAQLVNALKVATSGDKILLESENFSEVRISNLNIVGNVTITSADQNSRALLTKLHIYQSSGLTFENIDFKPASAGRVYSVETRGSHDIRFNSVHISGPDGDPGYTVSPFIIRNSNNISISNSEISHVWNGVSILDSNGVSITGNYFHDIRTDGVRGGGVSDLIVANNYFTDFHPISTDHADAIQLWTTGTTAVAQNIKITGNLIERGTGDITQGIFLRDQIGTLPFNKVVISDNLVIGAMYNGIALGHATASAINNNVVVGFPDMKSWILAGNSDGISLSGNTSATYVVNGASTTPTGNTLMSSPSASDGGAGALTQWLGVGPADEGARGMLPDVIQNRIEALVRPSVPPMPETSNMISIDGTPGADVLSAPKSGNSTLSAGAGNDTLNGSASGNHYLYGGAGDDTYRIYGPGDKIVEINGNGDDTAFAYVNYTLPDNVETLRMGKADLVGIGNSLNNRMVGTSGVDALYGGGGNDLIQGLDGNDRLFGDAGDDDIRGDAGNDTLSGGNGNDILSGGDGADVLDGGSGDDKLEGGEGRDILTGGLGADTFVFRGADLTGVLSNTADLISDFSRGQQDRISLARIDANVNTAGDEAFKFIGTSAFSGTAGELRYQIVDGSAFVTGDTNGDRVADFRIELTNVSTLSTSDFIL